MKTNTETIQDYILKNRRNLVTASAVSEAWLEARDEIVSDFLDLLNQRLKRGLKGWKSVRCGGIFLADACPGYYIWKAAWEDRYSIALECQDYGRSIAFGIERERPRSGRGSCCQELLDATKEFDPKASANAWWEAKMTMRPPATDWTNPEVLWRMHKDAKFLDDVAEQLLGVAKISEPFLDRLVRHK